MFCLLEPNYLVHGLDSLGRRQENWPIEHSSAYGAHEFVIAHSFSLKYTALAKPTMTICLLWWKKPISGRVWPSTKKGGTLYQSAISQMDARYHRQDDLVAL
jgi:hypothetical protein